MVRPEGLLTDSEELFVERPGFGTVAAGRCEVGEAVEAERDPGMLWSEGPLADLASAVIQRLRLVVAPLGGALAGQPIKGGRDLQAVGAGGLDEEGQLGP